MGLHAVVTQFLLCLEPLIAVRAFVMCVAHMAPALNLGLGHGISLERAELIRFLYTSGHKGLRCKSPVRSSLVWGHTLMEGFVSRLEVFRAVD